MIKIIKKPSNKVILVLRLLENPHLRMSKLRFFGQCVPKNSSSYTTS